jgi:CheY-like chemotaxis protein
MAKILVVDDEPSPVATLADNLPRDGHGVAIARDGEAA